MVSDTDRTKSRRQFLRTGSTVLVTGAMAGCSGAQNNGQNQSGAQNNGQNQSGAQNNGQNQSGAQNNGQNQSGAQNNGQTGPSSKIGIVTPLSGPFSNYGDQIVSGINLAINDSGLDVETVVRDSGTDPGTAVPVINELIQQSNINCLSGPVSSSVTLAAMDIVKREKIPFFNLSGSAKVSGTQCNKYTFQHMQNAFEFAGAVGFAYDQGLFDNIFLLGADFEAAHSNINKAKEILNNKNAEIINTKFVPVGNDDFSSTITEISDSGADTVYYSSGSTDYLSFINQAESASLDVSYQLVAPDLGLFKDLDPNVRSRIYGGTTYYWNGLTKEGDNWSDKFVNNFGEKPRYYPAVFYESTMEYLSAVKRTGTLDGDKVASEISGSKFTGVLGNTIQWRKCDNVSQKDIYMLNGKSEDESSGPDDVAKSIGSYKTEKYLPSCSERKCNL